MLAPTQREQLIAGLEQLNYSRIEHTSRRYVVFKTPDGWYYYVGKSGALRRGRTIASSIPTGSNERARIMAQGNQLIAERKRSG